MFVCFYRTFQTKLTYIKPGYILSFRLEPINRKILFDFDDVNSFLFLCDINFRTFRFVFE